MNCLEVNSRIRIEGERKKKVEKVKKIKIIFLFEFYF